MPKAEKLGYEYRGRKLGEEVEVEYDGEIVKGKIIGFDDEEDSVSFMAVSINSNDSYEIKNNCWVSHYLEGEEESRYDWISEEDILNIEIKLDETHDSILPEQQPSTTPINPLQEIRKIIDNEPVKLELFSEEFCVSLYETEVPITWSKKDGLQLITEICKVDLDLSMMKEVVQVMEIIESNLSWFAGMLVIGEGK